MYRLLCLSLIARTSEALLIDLASAQTIISNDIVGTRAWLTRTVVRYFRPRTILFV